MKISKKNNFFGGGVGGGGVGSIWGVRVDVNKELNFLGKLKKNIFFGGGVGVGGRGRVGGGNQGGCERRI